MLHASQMADVANTHHCRVCVGVRPLKEMSPMRRHEVMTLLSIEHCRAPSIVEVGGQCLPEDGASTRYLMQDIDLAPVEALDCWDSVAAEYDGLENSLPHELGRVVRERVAVVIWQGA